MWKKGSGSSPAPKPSDAGLKTPAELKFINSLDTAVSDLST